MTLLKLKNGQEATVLSVNKEAPCYDRLVELGFTSGESIRLMRRAPLGGPIQVLVRNASYALGRADARHIHIAS